MGKGLNNLNLFPCPYQEDVNRIIGILTSSAINPSLEEPLNDFRILKIRKIGMMPNKTKNRSMAVTIAPF